MKGDLLFFLKLIGVSECTSTQNYEPQTLNNKTTKPRNVLASKELQR